MNRSAAVIGAGFGGLALAIRLQSAGVATTVIEARDKPGGRAYFWEKDGHVFDAGPTVITDPDCLRELWATDRRRHRGRRRAHAGLAVLPAQLAGRDATSTISTTTSSCSAQIERARPGATSTGTAAFLALLGGRLRRRLCEARRGPVPRLRIDAPRRARAGPLPGLAIGLLDRVASFVRNEKLRQALSFHTLAGRRQPDDHQRDLRADPQARAGRRRVVRASAAPTG